MNLAKIRNFCIIAHIDPALLERQDKDVIESSKNI